MKSQGVLIRPKFSRNLHHCPLIDYLSDVISPNLIIVIFCMELWTYIGIHMCNGVCQAFLENQR